MKSKKIIIGLAGAACAAVAFTMFWPNKDIVLTQDVDASVVFGRYIDNPLHCDGLLAINAIQSYKVTDEGFTVGNSSLSGHWSPLAVTPQQIKSIIQNQITDCPPLHGIEFKDFIPLAFSGATDTYSFLFHPASKTAFMQSEGGEWRVIFSWDHEGLAGLSIDVSFKSDEVNGLDEALEEELFETLYPYNLRADIEFYDDPDFYEQFKESQALLEEFDRFERAAGEAQIEDFTNNR